MRTAFKEQDKVIEIRLAMSEGLMLTYVLGQLRIDWFSGDLIQLSCCFCCVVSTFLFLSMFTKFFLTRLNFSVTRRFVPYFSALYRTAGVLILAIQC